MNHLLSHGDEALVDVHQLNCTYYSALGCDDERYFTARAIQLFARGVPQIYYVGLLAGENDDGAVEVTGEGRSINRHNYSVAEVESNLQRPIVRRLFELLRLRNSHPAFDGTLSVEVGDESRLRLIWRKDDASCRLDADMATGASSVEFTGDLDLAGGALA